MLKNSDQICLWIYFFLIFLSVVLQPWRAKTDWSGCCQVAVQGTLWLAKHLSLNFNFNFLNRISLPLIQVATQLSSWGWVDLVPDPILPEKFLWYSRESNPGPRGWQSDVLTTIPNRRSVLYTCYSFFPVLVYPSTVLVHSLLLPIQASDPRCMCHIRGG